MRGGEPAAPARGPLAHLTVLDLTWHVAGPYCTRLMAGFGARVIKVERPGSGDPLRAVGPFAGGEAGPERSLPFLWLNAGKQSLTLDLRQPDGVRLAEALLARADVLVESFAPGTLARLGLGPERLRTANPRAVITSVTSFGSNGPYRDYRATEAVLYAMSGGMVMTGDPGRPPLAAGPAIVQYTAGMHAYLGTLLALYRRGVSGAGEHVEVSAHESALDNVEIALAEALAGGPAPRRTGDAHTMVPWQSYPCRDGHAAIIGGPVRRWLPAIDLFEEPRLGEERFRHMAGRIRHRQAFEALITPWLARHGKRDVYHAGQRRGLAWGYLASLPEAAASPQHAARGFFAPAEPHPVVGAPAHAGPPFTLGPGSWRTGRAPLLGEHTEAILTTDLAEPAATVADLRARGVV